jgi:hypothetical protein
MKTILIIEPHKMLQHAIAISLFPQYQTRVAAVIPVPGEIKDVDAVIIDAASLREINGLTAQAMASIQECKVPLIWIDDDDSPLVQNAKSVLVTRPIGRQSLQNAVAGCLDETSKTVGNGSPPAAGERARPAAHVLADQTESKVIELVDVVQEEPSGNKP